MGCLDAFSLSPRSQFRSVDRETPRRVAAWPTVRYRSSRPFCLACCIVKPYQSIPNSNHFAPSLYGGCPPRGRQIRAAVRVPRRASLIRTCRLRRAASLACCVAVFAKRQAAASFLTTCSPFWLRRAALARLSWMRRVKSSCRRIWTMVYSGTCQRL